jgi:DNA-directed RNA polymerase specialized sigma24 family protein
MPADPQARRAWLYGIARNHALHALHALRKERREPDTRQDHAMTPPTSPEQDRSPRSSARWRRSHR